MSWNLKPGTTLRAAGFRTLKRTLVTDQTLEPTQVAGFNQFFDDPSATESEVFGLAVRPEIRTPGLRRRRVLRARPHHPAASAPGRPHLDVVWEKPGEERQARVYLFGAVHPSLLSAPSTSTRSSGSDPELFLLVQLR